MEIKHLAKIDPSLKKLIDKEAQRQKIGLVLIPSENYTSCAVKEAVASVFENKYAEGYPGKRYYSGNEYVDKLESLCIKRAKKLFHVEYVNVQPYSGSPANLEIFAALCHEEDIVLSQLLSCGGHLSMGQKASFTGKYYKAFYYHLNSKGEVDFQELESLAEKYKPKIIWSGGTAYTKIFNWEKYAKIAEKVGAFFVADISHIAGLIVGKAHPDPSSYAHIIMTTTHKTLRGPRGAMIMVTKKGLAKDPNLPQKIDYAVFPGHQGGPHVNNIAGIAVALKEASFPQFRLYAKQIVKNAQVLAGELKKYQFKLIGDGTENHMIWIDLTNKKIDGWQMHITLEKAYIFGNKQTIPNDLKKPYYPSGFRIGTPAVTSKGMREKEMIKIANFINQGVKIAQDLNIKKIGHSDRSIDQQARRKFKFLLAKNQQIQKLKKEVINFSSRFPAPGIDI